MERYTWTLAIALALAVIGDTIAASSEPVPQVPQGWQFSFPAGDAGAGAQVFVKAESILNRHKVIAGNEDRYRGEDKRTSKMGDYSEIMTIRELEDVVAYLRSIQ